MKPGVRYVYIDSSATTADEIRQKQPRFIIIMPDWTTPSGGVYPTRFPRETYEMLNDGSLGYQRAIQFKNGAILQRQILDYPTVNPPIEVFVRIEDSSQAT